MHGPNWLGAVLFFGVQLQALWPVAALEVYTSKEVDAVNGTNLRLKCTFSSSSPISQHLSVTWNFQPEDLSSHEPVSETFTLHFIDAHLPKQTSPKAKHWVFYYLKEPYKLSAGRFKERVTWDGNIERNDVSIVIWNLQPTDNGTFTCQVKNPPDVDGTIGEVRLRVVQKVHFSEIHFLAVAIGSACVLMILVVIVVIICRHHQKKVQEKRIKVADTELREKENLKVGEEEEASPLEN